MGVTKVAAALSRVAGMPTRALSWAAVGIASLAAAGGALAAEPQPWEMNFQPAATPVMRDIENFHTALLWVISLISLFVLGLLLYVMFRFNHRKNPVPSRTTHNTLVEVAWTIVPILILVGISIYSFKLLYFEGDIPQAGMTIKATGHQWYWTFEYPDSGDFSFDANLVQQADLKPGQLRLLDHRQSPGGAGGRRRPGADHLHRRHPFLRRPLLRREGGCGAGAPQRDLVQGR